MGVEVSEQVLRFALYDLFEDDRVGVFDLVELLGLPTAPTRDACKLAGDDGGDLVNMSVAALTALAGYLKLLDGSERLEAAADELVSRSWQIVGGDEPMEGVGFCSSPTDDVSAAWSEAIDALRVPFLWAVIEVASRQLMVDGFVRGCWDLHSRPDGVRARDGRLPTIDPDQLLAELRNRSRSPGRGIPVLRVLPSLRDRLSVVLDLGLGLSAEHSVSAMCVEDPEAAELGGPDDEAARKRGVNNHRIVLFRARERIEDALLAGHRPLGEFLTGARQAPLPADIVALLRSWNDRAAPPEREQRRVLSLARLAWLSGRSDAVTRLGALLEATAAAFDVKALRAALVGAEAGFWRDVASQGLLPPPPWSALGMAGDSTSTTMVILRYISPVRPEERPGLETLGEALTTGPTGREAGVRAAQRLEAARGRLMTHLEHEDASQPSPPSASPPADLGPAGARRGAGSSDGMMQGAAACVGEALWPATWLGPREAEPRAAWRAQLREGLGQVTAARKPVPRMRREAARQLRGLREGVSSLVAQARWWLAATPGPPLGLATAGVLGEDAPCAGGRISLTVASPSAPEDVRPWVVREAGGESSTLFPPQPDRWVCLSEFRRGHDGTPIIDIVLAPPAGRHRYLVALVPTDAELPPDESQWAGWIRDGIEDGALVASALELDVADAPR